MAIGLYGYKKGMMRVYDDSGCSIACTVIEVPNTIVTRVKTEETDGYSAVQIRVGENRKVNKPTKGQFKHLDAAPGRVLKEIRLLLTKPVVLKLVKA